MNRLSSLSLFLLALVAFTPGARADHTLPEGSVRRLQTDTRDLDYAVRYSTLRYTVKQAVARFAWDVDRFVQCVYFRADDSNEAQSRDHDLVPEKCELYMHQIHQGWYQVNRYLYDTQFDYPNVYYRYARVRDDVRVLPGRENEVTH